jgi:hypothetical protein
MHSTSKMAASAIWAPGLKSPKPALLANAIALLLLLQFSSNAWASKICPAALGLRYGSVLNLSAETVDAERADLFAIFALPWQGRWGSDWGWQSTLELTLGHYSGDAEANAIALGLSLTARKRTSRLGLEAGLQLTQLSDSVLGARDLGRRTHFTSHFALLWRFSEHWLGGYRLQHISNASTRKINPGLNAQMLELRYRF